MWHVDSPFIVFSAEWSRFQMLQLDLMQHAVTYSPVLCIPD
jgi:hypothetical protein